MYDYMPIIMGIVIIALGLYMVVFPKSATKAEKRNDPNAVDKTMKAGVIEIICGICLILLGYLLL